MCQDCNHDLGPLRPSRRSFLALAGAALSLAACGKNPPPPSNADVPTPPATATKPKKPPAPDLGDAMFPDPAGNPIAKPSDAPVIMQPRSAWTNRKPNFADIDLMGKVERLTVHHTAMKIDSKNTDYKLTLKDIEDIRGFHTTDKNRQWADIAYHYVVDPAGRVWQGRPLVYQGAHAFQQNEHNLGIVVMGDFETQFPSAVQLNSLAAFIGFIRELYKIPVGKIFTHRELRETQCPGKNLQSYMNRARAEWAGGPVG